MNNHKQGFTEGHKNVIPTKVGIQTNDIALDSRLHRNDGSNTAPGLQHGRQIAVSQSVSQSVSQ